MPPLDVYAQLTLAADTESLAGPGAATGRTRLETVVAGETKNLQVLLAVVAAPKHREPVMNLERALAGRCSAHLACSAAGSYQRPPTRIGHWHYAVLLAVRMRSRAVRVPTSGANSPSRLVEHLPHRTVRLATVQRPLSSTRKTYSAQGHSSPQLSQAPAHLRSSATRTPGAMRSPPNMRLPRPIVAPSDGARRLGFRVEDGQRGLDWLVVARPCGRAGTAVPRHPQEECAVPRAGQQ